METNRELTELLGRDRESREFFASLTQGLRRRLMARDADNFKALHRAVSECGGQTFAAKSASDGQIAAADECTGAYPRGGVSAKRFSAADC